ncbi:MAG TPA: sigma-54 dependent transcriptional regulator [Terriglobales bacterium]|nr:sigma-54 dependent transcriptional regulator [Terriglobales bacterium]
MARKTVLVVDDDAPVRKLIVECFSTPDIVVEEAGTCEAAFERFRSACPDIAIVDYRLPDGDALGLIPVLKEMEPAVPIIVMTGYGSMDLGVALVKAGAEQCFSKPLEIQAFRLIVEKILQNKRNQQKEIASKSLRKRTGVDPFLGESEAIRELALNAIHVASSGCPVVIRGETGTGKGVLANWLHENGDRCDEAFVDLNCAGLSREFLETELFGYEKGAYTGAVNPKPGLLEVAHRGTVFLDEIGDVDLTVQPKLLKVVEEKRFRHLGDVRDRFVDVRLIAATHQDLSRLIEEGKFRSDLYFRISTLLIVIPPLRDRVEDIPVIARELFARISSDLRQPHRELSESAIARLQSHPWPGNIRELRNVLERAALYSKKQALDAKDLLFEQNVENSNGHYNGRLTLAELEQLHIQTVLKEEMSSVAKAAMRLGVPKSTLYQKIKALRISRNP